MALAVPVNPDLPSSYLIPGIFLKLNLAGTGAGLNLPSKRLLLMGYKSSAGTWQPDSPIQALSQSEVNTGAGRGSDLARLYAAAVSQGIAGLADIYCLPVNADAADTAQTRIIRATVTGTVTAGVIDIFICGYRATAIVAAGDSQNTIAASINTAIGLLLDVPVTSAVATNTVTLTYRHKGLSGSDLPIIVNQTDATGLTLSAGTVQITGADTGPGGSYTVSTGGTTVTATVAGADSANTIAASINTAINSGAFPFTSSVATDTVTLIYAKDRVVNQIVVAKTGTDSTFTASVGTAAVGGPTLTNALTNLQAQGAFPIWCTSFADGNGVSSSIATIKTHIDGQADGLNMKGQVIVFGSSAALATAGAVQTSTGVQSPTNGARFLETWSVDSPQQAYEIAARLAAAFVVEDYKPKNWDGAELKTQGTVPLMAPHAASRPSRADQNSALYTYYMTPIVYDEASNTQRVVRARTTSSDSDARNWDVSTTLTADYVRADMATFLASRFKQKSLKVSGTPKTPNTITATSVKDAIIERISAYDDVDFFDDAESLRSQVQVQQDSLVPTRLNVFIPFRPPVPWHQGSGGVYLV